jgi:hypothetical protein
MGQTTTITYWWADNVLTDVTLEKVRFYNPTSSGVQKVVVYLKINNKGTNEFGGSMLVDCYITDGLGNRYNAGYGAWMDVVNGAYATSIGTVPSGVIASGGLIFENVKSDATQYTITCPEGLSSGSYGHIPIRFTFSK